MTSLRGLFCFVFCNFFYDRLSRPYEKKMNFSISQKEVGLFTFSKLFCPAKMLFPRIQDVYDRNIQFSNEKISQSLLIILRHKDWQKIPHPNKLLAVELSKLFVQQLHISVEFKIWTKLKWSRKWFCCLPTSKMKKEYENIISVFTNIEEYQLFQIGEYLVVEGTHVKQVIQVLVGALDYHFITSCVMISNAFKAYIRYI